jgi:archaellum component FlaD/FlaE
MGKGNNAPSTEGATSKEVKEKEVVAEVVETATEETAEVVETATEETATEETAEVVETATEETAEVVETTTEETATEEVTPVNGVFEVNGKKYKLSDRCPGKVQFNGTVYTREDLLTNAEVLESLVIGQSPFVKKV